MHGAELYVGTSGFSYQDWLGHFYPEGTKKADFLAYYSGHFKALEVNYTYYRLPTRRTMASLVEKSGGSVRFSVKLTNVFTHERTGGKAEAKQFVDAVEPMADTGVLGCLLAQFPYSFKPSADNYACIARLHDWFEPNPLAVEVRNRGWVSERFFEFLKETGIGFCCVDEPRLPGLLPDLKVVTSDIGYVRFHGRNRAKWWQHDRPEERYDYLYSEAELSSWVSGLLRMSGVCRELFVFFNNHFEGKAVANAVQMRELLAPRPE